MASFERLRRSYNKLGDDIKAKEQFILDNQSAFTGLGVAINGVNEADNLFIKQTEAFRASVMARAKAAAAMELATEKYRKALEQEKRAERADENPRLFALGRTNEDGTTTWRRAERLRNKAEGYRAAAGRFIQASIDSETEAADKLREAGIRTVEAAENIITVVDNTLRDYERATERLRRLGIDAQRDTDAAIIAVMQEGRDKRLAELEHEHNLRLARIAEQQKEIAELEYTTGIDGSRQREQLKALAAAETAKYEARVKAVVDGAANAIASIMEDIESRFQTSSERRIADINRFFDAQIEKAKENAATLAQLNEIQLQRNRLRFASP